MRSEDNVEPAAGTAASSLQGSDKSRRRDAPLPISCFIIAKNEADRLPRALQSVSGLVDDVVVVDSGSTDETVAIAEAAGARVIYNKWPGFGQQKRFAEQQCRNRWLLNLDADEEIDDLLKREIRSLFEHGTPREAAFGMWASVVYPGESSPRPLARDHYVYRLYDSSRVRFADSTLFDSVETRGHPRRGLQGRILHHTVRSMGDLVAKCDARASYNASNARRKPTWQLAIRLVTELPLGFLRYYFLRGHILGGFKGLQYAAIVSYYRFVRIVRMTRGASPDATRDPDLGR